MEIPPPAPPGGPCLDGMMSKPGTNLYQRNSVWIMAILIFLLPLVVVGAIKAKGNNRNDVKGWLPLEYPETQTYRFFRRNFQGEEFILISWEGCTMADPRLELLAQKLLPPPEEASESLDSEGHQKSERIGKISEVLGFGKVQRVGSLAH